MKNLLLALALVLTSVTSVHAAETKSVDEDCVQAHVEDDCDQEVTLKTSTEGYLRR